ncbi:MAG: 50S ribosomal protein L29 [Candidatus Sungbacteria bacterium RIFCSPLOWO2_01_FULL_60_25]|uniref:Large ribosomal subunit protein uL29 n=1 Tax=Candidatus Sungbacteria bacterium RIFCSPLOWO2_01_FULL_60_25 TaxID=1802281 RepID=A0A1G2LBY6_9BACT|nr:MAG: 50S ribosomal protein L29 [Candidatus Sungbacteria bacterium RIFCSPLOWO2_01_FULL_60_25]
MKPVDLRKKSPAELAALLREWAAKREELALAIRQKKQKNVKELRELRRDIARAKTIIREGRTRI